MQKIIFLITILSLYQVEAREIILNESESNSLKKGEFYKISLGTINCNDTVKVNNKVFPAILFKKIKFDLYNKCDTEWNETKMACHDNSAHWYCPLVKRIEFQQYSASQLSEKIKSSAISSEPKTAIPSETQLDNTISTVNKYDLNAQYWQFTEQAICDICDKNLFSNTRQDIETLKGLKNPDNNPNTMYNKVKVGFCSTIPSSNQLINITDTLYRQLNNQIPNFNPNENDFTLIQAYNNLCNRR